jgi:uncharacterized RDD family membrane protein YckC
MEESCTVGEMAENSGARPGGWDTRPPPGVFSWRGISSRSVGAIRVNGMRAIARYFLRAKHWQIFLLLVGITIVADVVLVISILATPRAPQDLLKAEVLFGAVMVPLMFCFLGWFWSMGSFLTSILQPPLRLKMGFFRFAVIYPVLYTCFFLAVFQSTKPVLLLIVFPLHFFAMFCVFYVLYFVTKSLKIAETHRPASFHDYVGPFFLLWFFPAGVWVIQPRINRLYLQSAASPMGTETELLPLPAIAVPPMLAAPVPGIPPQGPMVCAGFWRRFAAALIDGVVMFFPFCVVGFVMIFILRLAGAKHGYDPTLAIAVTWPLVTILLVSSYFVFLESSLWQATLGKMALGLYVSDIEGHRLTLGRAMSRTLAKCVSSLTLGVGYLLCGFTKKKQALHDMIASSLVLRRSARG